MVMLVTARTKDSEPGLPCEDSSLPLAYTSYPSSSGGARPDIRPGPAAGTPCDDPRVRLRTPLRGPRDLAWGVIMSRMSLAGEASRGRARRTREGATDDPVRFGLPRPICARAQGGTTSGWQPHALPACHAAPQAAQQAHEWPTSMPVGSSTKTRPRPTSAATVLLFDSEWGQRPKYSTEEKGRRSPSLSPTSCIYRLHLDVNLVRIVVLAEPKR